MLIESSQRGHSPIRSFTRSARDVVLEQAVLNLRKASANLTSSRDSSYNRRPPTASSMCPLQVRVCRPNGRRGVLQPWCVGACVDLMALAPSHDPKGLHSAVMHREAGHPTADPRHASINGRRVRSCSPFFGRSSAERGRGAAKQGCGHEGRGAGALRLCISQSTLASRSIARAARYCQSFAFAVARSLSHTSTLPVVGEGFSMHGMEMLAGRAAH